MYNSIIKQRGLTEISYQRDFLTNGEFLKSKKPFVLAMGTSAGKTLTTIMMLEIIYSNPLNKNKKTLIIPSSTIELRKNFEKSLIEFQPNFTYQVPTNKKELINSINSKCSVIVCLPQTLIRNIDLLSNYDYFILDEAHQWYFRKTIENIILKINPKHQLLLCGSPSRFVAKSNLFNFKFVPIEDLYKEGLVTNARIKIIKSDYSIFEKDFESTWGDLRSKVKLKDKETEITFNNALKDILNNTIGKTKLTELNIGKKFMKTIIFCHSISQSNKLFRILQKDQLFKERTLISHQESDKESILFDNFRKDKKQKILICVNRGRLGFSMNHLFNVIDFTLTKNIDTMLQIYGRLLRTSSFKEGKKVYFKVSPKGMEVFFTNIMTGMLSLTQMEYYTKFNGKDLSGVKVPMIKNPSKYHKTPTLRKHIKISNKVDQFDLEKFGLDIDLDLFKYVENENRKSNNSIFSYTSLNQVRKTLFPSKKIKWTTETVTIEARKYKNRREFNNKSQSAYFAARRLNIMDKVCVHMVSKIQHLTETEIIKVAKGFTVKADFRKNNRKVYWKAKQLGILDKVCKHMKQTKSKEFLTDNQIKIRAKKYKKRIEFSKSDPPAYRMAQKRGLLDIVCSHMSKRAERVKKNT